MPTSSSPKNTEPLRLRIERLAHGGEGLAHHQGELILTPFTAPGDEVLVRRLPSRAGVGRAQLLAVEKPGPERVESPCPVAGVCGGCQLQHLSGQGQSSAKVGILRDLLERIGGFSSPPLLPLVDSPRPFRYRRRLRFFLGPGGWGFHRARSWELVNVDACLLAEEVVEEAAREVSRAVREIGGFGAVGALEVDALESGDFALHLSLADPSSAKVWARTERLLSALPKLQGVVLTQAQEGRAGGNRSRAANRPRTEMGKRSSGWKGNRQRGPSFTSEPVLIGNPVLIDPGHHRLRVRPDLFAQANRLGARLLASAGDESIPNGARVLELYAGAGTLTLGYAKKVQGLWLSEIEGPSLDLAGAALAEQGLEARLLAGTAENIARSLAQEGARFDHVLLDPPRAGAKDVVPSLLKLSPERITYVSCEPSTFARDARALLEGGYEMLSVQPFDLFPQTWHLELVGIFERRRASD